MSAMPMPKRLAKIEVEAGRLRKEYDLRRMFAGGGALLISPASPPIVVRIARIKRDTARIYRVDGRRFDTDDGPKRRIWVSRDCLQPMPPSGRD